MTADTQPVVDPTDPTQLMLLSFWREARDARDDEIARGPRPNNLAASIAAHKMGWCAQVIRALRELRAKGG